MGQWLEPDGASIADDEDVFRSLFKTRFSIAHHLGAPLFSQRAQYLRHLERQGRCRKTLKDTAALLLHVIRVLALSEKSLVDNAAVRNAAASWAKETLPHRVSPSGKAAAAFCTAANGFLRYHGLRAIHDPLASCFDPVFFAFRDVVMARGYRSTTVRGILPPVQSFLFWLAQRTTKLSSLSPEHIDNYLLGNTRSLRWLPRTVLGKCRALRAFLRFAELQGLCRADLSQAVTAPVVKSRDCIVSGPSWRDVREMIQLAGTSSASECRAKAILLLCSVYGLRNVEVIRLTTDAFDWNGGSFSLRRAKNGYWQRFPIMQELRDVTLDYIRNHRPTGPCRSLFVTLLPPYRQLQSVGPVIRKHMRLSNIGDKSFGPHSLRHSCATELLRLGTSLQSIANLLGHRDLRSVSVYARHDSQALRAVADFHLSELI